MLGNCSYLLVHQVSMWKSKRAFQRIEHIMLLSWYRVNDGPHWHACHIASKR